MYTIFYRYCTTFDLLSKREWPYPPLHIHTHTSICFGSRPNTYTHTHTLGCLSQPLDPFFFIRQKIKQQSAHSVSTTNHTRAFGPWYAKLNKPLPCHWLLPPTYANNMQIYLFRDFPRANFLCATNLWLEKKVESLSVIFFDFPTLTNTPARPGE